MKKSQILTAFISALGLSSCAVTPPEIPTVPLGDAVIALAKEARRAGANQLTYTASITVAKSGEGSIAVPVSAASVGLGASITKGATSTVEIVVPIETTAAKPISGKRYILNRQSNTLREVQ